MKKTRKIAAVAAAMALAATMAVPSIMMSASAADITIQNVGEVSHSFEIYQIMTGTKSGDDFTELKWGTGISEYDGTAVSVGADVPDSVLTTISGAGFDARTLVSGASPLITLSTTKTDAFGTGDVQITGLEEGYYVIKDVTNLTSSDDANSAWIVQVAGPTSVNIKKAKPEVDKTVYDNDDGTYKGTGTDNDGFYESADHAINEEFQFKLTATIPADSDLAAYDTYKLVFHDTMSSGVTFDRIDSVTVGGTAITASDYSETATANTEKAGLYWALTIEDVKGHVPSTLTWGTDAIVVEVTYTAHLNANAIVSEAGVTADNTINNNKVKLEYSNNPDSLGNGSTDDTGETPEDYVWVFTYKVDNTKYKINSSAGNELNGAAFTLHKDAADGTVVGVTWDATAASGEGAYVVNGTTSGSMTSGNGDAAGTTSGKFNIIGLDAGKYVLVEDEAPQDFNKADPVEFTITAAHSENSAQNSADLTLNQTNNGENTIVDTKNSTLPSTGGMGTTLFIVCGSLTAAAAGVYLVSKKRAKEEDAQ